MENTMSELSSPIEAMFQEGFGLDVETMEVDTFYDVEEHGIGIKSYNEEGGICFKKVLKAIKKGKSPIYTLQIPGAAKVKVSGAHKFAVLTDEGNLRWLSAETLSEMDIRELTFVTVYGNKPGGYVKDAGYEDYVYDIEVEDTSNYFSNGVLSHNSLYGADFKVAGGFAQRFYSSHTNRVTKIEFIKEKGVITGIMMKVKNHKSKIGMPFREVILKLDFKKGFDVDDEYLEFMEPLGLVERRGAYYRSEKYGFNCQGKTQLLEWLKDNPAEYQVMKDEINKLIAQENQLDADVKDPTLEPPLEEQFGEIIEDPESKTEEDQEFMDLGARYEDA
jgi:hypothetical protein